MRTPRFALAGAVFALILPLSVALAGCGGDDKKDEPAADSGSSSGASDSTSGGSDTAATDSGSSTSSSSGGTDSGSSSGGTDTAKAKTNCADTLYCRLDCNADKTCIAACDAAAEAQAKTDAGAIGTCAVDMCKDVTEGSAAEAGCAYDKCYDKLSACTGFGDGKADCTATVRCLAKCPPADLGCAAKCMVAGDKGGIKQAAAVKRCVDKNCLSAPAAKQEQCIIDKCATEIGTCTDGKSPTCKELNQCEANCPQVSVNSGTNYCLPFCRALAGADARKKNADFDTCKAKCPADTKEFACWNKTCEAEIVGCYGKGGAQTCQDVFNCVYKDCESIGGEQSCVEACLAKGQSAAQDAYIAFEGCVLSNVNSEQGKIAKCAYPYDQQTCIPTLLPCSKLYTNCFSSQ